MSVVVKEIEYRKKERKNKGGWWWEGYERGERVLIKCTFSWEIEYGLKRQQK